MGCSVTLFFKLGAKLHILFLSTKFMTEKHSLARQLDYFMQLLFGFLLTYSYL